MSTLTVDKIDPQSGTALEIGSSGDTMTVPSGATFTVAGTLGATSAANLTNIPAANVTGTLPAISGANLTDASWECDSSCFSYQNRYFFCLTCCRWIDC